MSHEIFDRKETKKHIKSTQYDREVENNPKFVGWFVMYLFAVAHS